MDLPVLPHFCHAPDCTEEIANDDFFCSQHYQMLPKEMQKRIDKVSGKGESWLSMDSRVWSPAVDPACSFLLHSLGLA